MFLEDAHIHLPYSCDAMTRSWSVHGFAHQGACLLVGDTLASPSSLFHIDHHADHAQPESGARFGNLTHGAFSSAVSGNVRILEEIRHFGTIRLGDGGTRDVQEPPDPALSPALNIALNNLQACLGAVGKTVGVEQGQWRG